MKDAFRLAAKTLLRIEEYVVMVTAMASCLMLIAGAFMRYVLSKDFYGMEELVVLCALWLYFFGSAIASKNDTHLTADLVISLIKSKRNKALLNSVRHGVTFIICAIGTVWSYNYIVWIFERGPVTAVLKFPTIYMQIPILIGFVLMNLYILGHLINDIRFLTGKEEKTV